MSSPRLAYGSLHHHGAGLLPDDLEGVDYLLLDGGPVLAPDEEGPDDLLDEAIRRLSPTLYLNSDLKVIASLAGRDPEAAARRIAAILSESGNADLPIGVVYGSDVLDRLEEFLAAGEHLKHDLNDELFTESTMQTEAAAVLIDGEAAIAPFNQGAKIVLAGRADTMAIQPAAEGLSLNRDSGVRLDLVLHAGWQARMLLRSPLAVEHHYFQSLAKNWTEALRSGSLPSDIASFEAFSKPGERGASVALATYRGPEESVVREGVRLLQQACNPVDRPAELEVLIPPQIDKDYRRWPTSIPTDLVEWSVDVRPAKDWVE